MAGGTVWLRVVLLAVLAVGANLWLERHLGHGLEDPIGLLGLAGGASVLSAVLDWSLKDVEKEKLKAITHGRLRELLRRVLSTPVLVVLCLLGGVIAATYASVSVVPPRNAKAELTIAPADDPEAKETSALGAGGKAERILMETNPLGRELMVTVEGYVPKRMTLYPLTGLSIDVEADLEPLPTLLFRPPVDAMGTLNSGGRFVVYRVEGERCVEVGASSAALAGARAFVLGSRRATPPSYAALWNLELLGAGNDQVVTNQMLRAWLRPEALTAASMLQPGDVVYAAVLSRADRRKAEAELVIGREPFQDIAMIAVAEGAPSRCLP